MCRRSLDGRVGCGKVYPMCTFGATDGCVSFGMKPQMETMTSLAAPFYRIKSSLSCTFSSLFTKIPMRRMFNASAP